MTITDGGVLNTAINTSFGNGGIGTLTMTGGTMATGSEMFIGNGGGSSGTAVFNGGLITMGASQNIGTNNSFGTMIINGGTMNIGRSIGIGGIISSSGTGILIINGGLVIAQERVVTGEPASALGIIELNGGILSTPFIFPQNRANRSFLVFNGGTLQARSNRPNDFISAFIPGNLFLDFGGGTIDTNGFTVGITSEMNGPGGLTVTSSVGSGILRLTASNTYSGTTTISAGTLVQGAANAFSPNSDVSIASRGTLDAGGFDATIGSLSGDAGSLVTDSGAAATLSIGNTNRNGIFAGTIQNGGGGPLSIIKVGTGTQIFTGNNTYTGSTTIQVGELQVNAQLASPNVTVVSGGILSGIGTLAGNVFNFGAVSPGTSPGVLTVLSNYTQFNSGTLVIQIADVDSFSQLVVGNTATLDGTLNVDLLNGFEPTGGDEFVILTATGGVDGTFALVNEPLGSLLEVIYDPNEVILLIVAGPSSTTASTPSGRHVAGIAGNPRGTFDRVGRVLDALGVPFTELVPHIAGMTKDVIFGAANVQYSELTTRLAAIRSGVTDVSLKGLPQEPMREQLAKHEKAYKPVLTPTERLPWDIYAFASGVFSCMQNVSDLPKIKSQVGYFGAGADYRFNEYFILGTYVGYQGMWSRFEKNRMQSNGVKWGLYGTADWEGFYVNAIVGGGANFLNKRRTIDLLDVVYRATSHPFVGELDSLLGGGYEYRWNNWIFGANNSIQYTYAGMTGYRERGADTLNVRVDRENFSSLIYTLGGNISYLWEFCENFKVLPTAGLSWQHEFLNKEQRMDAALNNGLGAPFYFYTRSGARNFALGTAGVTAQMGRIGAWAYWTQFLGHQLYSNAVQVGLSYSF